MLQFAFVRRLDWYHATKLPSANGRLSTNPQSGHCRRRRGAAARIESGARQRGGAAQRDYLNGERPLLGPFARFEQSVRLSKAL